jgi:hypothetical protein
MKDSLSVVAGAATTGTFLTTTSTSGDELLKLAIAGVISLITQIALKRFTERRKKKETVKP